MTPEPVRPGWSDALRMSWSVLPYASLLPLDERLAKAAAVPVIVPQTVVSDHGKVFISDNFRNACRHLGISFQPAHPDTDRQAAHRADAGIRGDDVRPVRGRLIRMDACYQYGSDFWHSLFQRGYRLSDRAERLRQLSPVNGQVRPFDPRRYIAVYPEIVETISLYASPYWRRLALADDAKFERFKDEFNRRLPQERALRTAREWFLTELRRTAMRIEASTESSQRGRPVSTDLS